MKKAYIILIILAMIVAFVFGFNSRGTYVKSLAGELVKLKNDWVMSQAQVISQADMNKKLANENASLDKKYRKEANARASLQAELDEIRGRGPAVVYVDKPGMKFYEDAIVNLSYSSIENEFDYRIKSRPITVTAIKNKGAWVAEGYDPGLERTIKISRFDIYETPVKVKWYSKVWTATKYIGVAALAGGVGYLAGRAK